jgi:isocitrate lyase
MTTTFLPNPFRTYTNEDVVRLRGSFSIDYSIARMGSNRLWALFNGQPYVRALGCLTGNQAVQMVRAGLDAIYLSGWQVAADGNSSGNTYPDQSLYPANSVPNVVKRLNNALLRADQIESADSGVRRYWLAPIVADAEAGFGGCLNSYELMRSMIEAGAAGVHFEDQLSSEKKCGHLHSKVLVPTKSFIKHLVAARLAADICNTSTVIIGRTDADSASWITSDADEYDKPFIDMKTRSDEGFYKLIGDPMERCIARGLAYAPHCDMLWMETSTPNLDQAKAFAEGIHKVYPGKMLAYNCSPSFNWKKHLSDHQIAGFQDRLGELGVKFNFITLAGWHSIAEGMFDLADQYKQTGMTAYVDLQQHEFASESKGYSATKHQTEVGTGYFDQVRKVIDGHDESSALKGSTEHKQF